MSLPARWPSAALVLVFALCGCSDRPDAMPVSVTVAQSNAADVAAVREFLDDVQRTFNAGDLEAFLPVFADDAVILSQGEPAAVGAAAIRTVYENALAQMDIKVGFQTEEIEVFGDLAYERGTFILQLTDRKSGQSLGEVKNRHIHILRRQPGGGWKTWRMMSNSETPAPAAPPG